MIMSSDREFTLWPKPGAELTIDLAKSSFSIPIVGGQARCRRRACGSDVRGELAKERE
jgi:X-Pro dipeptidyl-peptidase